MITLRVNNVERYYGVSALTQDVDWTRMAKTSRLLQSGVLATTHMEKYCEPPP